MGAKIKAGPILKWAGGKARLIKQMHAYLPSDLMCFNCYVEPFVGGGAMLFWMLNNCEHLRIETFIANDSNSDLIGMYKAVQSNVGPLIDELERLQRGLRCSKDPNAYYCARRDEYNDKNTSDMVLRAALMIFLNKTCYNGLYRVNKEGKFNVPFGHNPHVTIYTPEQLLKDNEAFERVQFTNVDYSKAVATGRQDKVFYYFDPPYRPINPTSSFTSYTKSDFGEADQIALAKHCRELHNRHAFMMISNSDAGDDFYAKMFPSPSFYLHKIVAPRFINSNASMRGNINEILITNYDPQHSQKAPPK